MTSWIDTHAQIKDDVVLFELEIPTYKIAILRTGFEIKAVVSTLEKEAGTWAVPRKVSDLQKIKSVIDKLKGDEYFNIDDVQDDLYNVLGDDILFDELNDLDGEPCSEVISAIKKRFNEIMQTEPEDWNPPFDVTKQPPEYQQLVQDISGQGINASAKKKDKEEKEDKKDKDKKKKMKKVKSWVFSSDDLGIELQANDSILDINNNVIALDQVAEMALEKVLTEAEVS